LLGTYTPNIANSAITDRPATVYKKTIMIQIFNNKLGNELDIFLYEGNNKKTDCTEDMNRMNSAVFRPMKIPLKSDVRGKTRANNATRLDIEIKINSNTLKFIRVPNAPFRGF
jgi:hypothetical protein